jgi:hypothetical protein
VHTQTQAVAKDRFAQCIANSKRIRWNIDEDVIRGRTFDLAHKFLPDGLTKMSDLDFLTDVDRRYLSQIQGRTYANVFGLVERFINAKVLELSRDHWLGDQTALEALVRFCDEELKHQELFRRVEELIGKQMPAGYRFDFNPNAIAEVVLDKSTWAVLARPARRRCRGASTSVRVRPGTKRHSQSHCRDGPRLLPSVLPAHHQRVPPTDMNRQHKAGSARNFEHRFLLMYQRLSAYC